MSAIDKPRDDLPSFRRILLDAKFSLVTRQCLTNVASSPQVDEAPYSLCAVCANFRTTNARCSEYLGTYLKRGHI